MIKEDLDLYLQKLSDCDESYFKQLEVGDELYQELYDYLKRQDTNIKDFVSNLLDYFDEYGDFGNEENLGIAKWCIYQDREYYEYGDSELPLAGCLAGALARIENENGTQDWIKHGCYWTIMAERLGYEFSESDEQSFGCMEGFIDNVNWSTPYPDYTTNETKLILSEMCYNYVCENLSESEDCIDFNIDIDEAIRILSKSDIRLAKIKSFGGALNKKAPEIHKRLCKNTALALFFFYQRNGENKKALKELKNSGVTDNEKQIEIFAIGEGNGVLIDNPIFKRKEGVSQSASQSAKKGTTKKRKKKSFLSKVKSTLRHFLK